MPNPPKHNPAHRGPRVGPVRLPAEGRKGAPPEWPLPGDVLPGEADAWVQLWHTPQAVAWEQLGWSRTVARYCRLLVRCEKADATAALLTAATQLEDRLGMTPKAMRLLLWTIVEDEVGEHRQGGRKTAKKAATPNRPLRAVDAELTLPRRRRWRGPEVKGEYPTLGFIAADWIESNLVLTDGAKMGQPFRLYNEQLRYLLQSYRLNPAAKPADGADAFVYGGSMLVRGQKWGKDPLLAAVALFHAFGPCEFGGWDEAGEPVGVPHPSPWIAVAATNDQQTDNTWVPLLEMAKACDAIVSTPGVEIFDSYVQLPCGNSIEALTTTAMGRLGGRFTFVSITESGILFGDGKRGGLTFARTLKRNVGGMNGRWMSATNPWDPTEHSDAQETYEAKDPHVYVDMRLARTHVDLDDDDGLLREIRYQYGDALRSAGGHQSEQRLLRDCQNKAMGESEVRRFYLGEITAGEKSAVTPERWAALYRSDDPLQPGEAITLGFDGSRSRDATALTACRISDGRLFHLRTWFPTELDGHKVPRLEVDQAVRDAFEAYNVWYLYADPYRWQDYLDNWAGDFEKQVVEFPTNVETRMDKAISRFIDAYQDGSLTHSGHEVLTEHAGNAALKKGKKKPPREGDDGLRIEHYLQVTKKRDGLIDAFVSAILAYEARGQAIEDGALVPEESVEPFAII